MRFTESRKTSRIQADIDILNDAWVCINRTRAPYGGRIEGDVVVSFTKSKKTLVLPDRVSLRLSKELCEKMKWSHDDRLVAYSHPENVFLLKICKSSGMNGWKMIKDHSASGSPFRLTIKWHTPDGITLHEMPSHAVNHQIYKECLVMDISKDANE